MTRHNATPAGGGGRATKGPGSFDDVEVDDESDAITARASGFATLDFLEVGSYFDLNDDGIGVSPTQSELVWTDVPPGNSFNEDHYATDDGPGASRSEASSELVGASLRLTGEMREAVVCDITWLDPDFEVAFETTVETDDPSSLDCGGRPCEWFTWTYFYSFIGRGFEQGAEPEITKPGVYSVEFDTNYGTWSKTVNLVGPEVTGCSVPSEVPAGETATAEATVSNTDDSQYSGTLVAAAPMTDTLTERGPLTLGTSSFSIAPGVVDVFDVPINADEIGGVDTETDVEIYCVTDSLNAPVTDGDPIPDSTDSGDGDGSIF